MKKPTTYRIRPIDFKVGMFVMVEEWLDDRNACIGLPVKILSLALPLMTVEYLPAAGVRGVMDTRQAKFTRVGLRYVKSLVPSYSKKKAKTKELTVL